MKHTFIQNIIQIIKILFQVQTEWETQYVEFRGPRVTYHRPTTLAELLKLKTEHPQARIIVGNTEVGEMKKIL